MDIKAAAEAALDCGQTLEIDPRDWLALEARVASAEGQNEWLKTRLANLQLPAHLAHKPAIREEWLLDCGMPTRAHFQSQGGDHGRD